MTKKNLRGSQFLVFPHCVLLCNFSWNGFHAKIREIEFPYSLSFTVVFTKKFLKLFSRKIELMKLLMLVIRKNILKQRNRESLVVGLAILRERLCDDKSTLQIFTYWFRNNRSFICRNVRTRQQIISYAAKSAVIKSALRGCNR